MPTANTGKRPAILWAPGGVEPAYTHGMDFDDVSDLESAHPETIQASGGDHTWSIETTVVDSPPASVELHDDNQTGHVFRTIALSDLEPDTSYLARMRVWQDREGPGGILVGLRSGAAASYYEDVVPYSGNGQAVAYARWVTLAVPFISDPSGEASILYGFWNSVTGGTFLEQIRLIRFDTLSVVETALLRFGFPADEALSSPLLRPRARRFSDAAGGERGQFSSIIDRLTLTARWIPSEDSTTPAGHEASGWDSAGGWQDFLSHAWAGGEFLFYPDQENLVTAYTCKLEQPRPFGGGGEPPYTLEADGSRKLQLSLRCLDRPFLGY